MAKVEFTNIYKEKVLDNVQKLIKQTIPGIPLYYDEHRGQESFLLRPISDTFIDYASNAHIRTYITEISFEILFSFLIDLVNYVDDQLILHHHLHNT